MVVVLVERTEHLMVDLMGDMTVCWQAEKLERMMVVLKVV
jgi:hypothetical protein